MKKKVLLITFCLTNLNLICGCYSNGTPMEVYDIGRKYEFENFDIQLDLESESERFVFHYVKSNDYKRDFDYSVIFSCDVPGGEYIDSSKNQNKFEYKYENNEIINFDESGEITLSENSNLYIYYSNAPKEVLTVIKDEDPRLSFDISGFTFVFYNL